ncbi:MAG: hypothetical protein GXP58_02985 [Deltaproteobacteria bacterium]|nr:hypothetical protein [Deltaproteobacteria bacterium]
MTNQTNTDIKIYYYLFLRNRTLFFSLFVAVFTTVSLSSLFFPKVYESTTVIRAQKEQPNPIGTGKLVREDPRSNLKTLEEMILSRTSLNRAIKEMKLDGDIASVEQRERLLMSVRKRVKIRSIGAGLFSIAFQDHDPEGAMRFTQTLSSIFIEESLALKRNEAYSSVGFIKKQKDLYKKKLQASEEALRKFKLAHIDEMPGKENASLVQLQRLRDTLASTSLELQEDIQKKELIAKQLSGEKPMVVSMMSGGATSTVDKIKVLQFQLSQLLANYTEKHPDVIRIRSEIEKLKKEGSVPGAKSGPGLPRSDEFTTLNPLHQKLKENLNNIEISIGTLKHKEQILKGEIRELEKKVRSIPNREKELVGLQRDYNVNEKIYQMLLMKLQEARISKALEVNQGGTRFEVVDPPNLPVFPVKPNLLHFLLAGLALGCAAGAGSIFLKDYFNSSTWGVREAEEVFGLPVLAAVPVIETEESLRKKKHRRIQWILGSFLFLLCVAGTIAFAVFHVSIR